METIKKHWLWVLLALVIVGGLVYYFYAKKKIDGANAKKTSELNEQKCKADLDAIKEHLSRTRLSAESCRKPALEKMTCPNGAMTYEPTCQYEVDMLKAKGWS